MHLLDMIGEAARKREQGSRLLAGKSAYLEREQGLEVVVDLPGVGAAPPVAGQVVGVCHHFQQSQFGVKGYSRLLYEGSA